MNAHNQTESAQFHRLKIHAQNEFMKTRDKLAISISIHIIFYFILLYLRASIILFVVVLLFFFDYFSESM